MLQGTREIQKWVCGKPTNTSTFTKPPQLWSDVVFCVIHLSGGLETTNGMRSTKPQHKVSYYCASKFMIMKNMKATCSSILFCTFHWIWLASHLALLVDPAGHDFGDNFYVWMDLNGMFHGKSLFCCRYFPYHKKISQRKAHVLPDLHFWLVEITQKWDDVRLEPGIRSGQRSTSPVFEGLGTKNNRSIGNIGPGMARLWLEELATIHGDADPPSPYCFPKNGAPLLFC
jgi:hypothetical protein